MAPVMKVFLPGTPPDAFDLMHQGPYSADVSAPDRHGLTRVDFKVPAQSLDEAESIIDAWLTDLGLISAVVNKFEQPE